MIRSCNWRIDACYYGDFVDFGAVEHFAIQTFLLVFLELGMVNL